MSGKNRKLFLADYCLTPFDQIMNAGILCEGSRIIATGGASAFSTEEEGLEVIKVPNAYATPGFIDSHIHGINEFDAADVLTDGIEVMDSISRILAVHGVTAFLPTIVSQSKDKLIKTIAALTDVIEKGCDNADPVGLHVEGPFINQEKRGSQSLDSICDIDLGLAKEMIDAGSGRLKLMTFAPELPNADKLIELMLENGVIPSMGHSLADEEQTLRAIDAGARRCTYIFNGMPLLHHRQSSLTSVALTDDRVAVEIIVDGLHVHHRMVDLVSRVKPIDKLIGISNAVVKKKADKPTDQNDVVTTSDGIIQGASMTLETSWLQLAQYSGMAKNRSAACFSHNPAKDLGLISRGDLKPGNRADITFFDTRTNQVCMTVARGNIVYRACEENQ